MLDPESLPLDLGELRADYRQTITAFNEHLDPNPFFRADLGDGIRMYAIHMPALSAYGALKGDDRLMAIITEVAEGSGKSYTVVVHHFGERLGEISNPPEETVYWSAFGNDDLDDYDADAAEKIRAILQDASDNNWFSSEEAWYQVKNRYNCDVIRNAVNAQRRSERRMRNALVALLVEEIRTSASS